MEELEAKPLPTLVDNTEKFKTVEKQTSPALTKPPRPDTLAIQYPKVGNILYFEGQRFAITSELNRHRFVIKWRG